MTMASGSADTAGRGPRISVTQIVSRNEDEPENEYQYADRIARDIQMLNEPHFILSVMKSVQQRINAIRAEQTGK